MKANLGRLERWGTILGTGALAGSAGLHFVLKDSMRDVLKQPAATSQLRSEAVATILKMNPDIEVNVYSAFEAHAKQVEDREGKEAADRYRRSVEKDMPKIRAQVDAIVVSRVLGTPLPPPEQIGSATTTATTTAAAPAPAPAPAPTASAASK